MLSISDYDTLNSRTSMRGANRTRAEVNRGRSRITIVGTVISHGLFFSILEC